jgi:hypothetical protein
MVVAVFVALVVNVFGNCLTDRSFFLRFCRRHRRKTSMLLVFSCVLFFH